MFKLAPELQRDTFHLGHFPLCSLLLMNDSQFPWFVLVPRREDVSEIFQLRSADQQQLLAEVSSLAEKLKDAFQADKMNVAALGNVVKQLHVHVIARYQSDAAWPSPIWGRQPPAPYEEAQVDQIVDRLKRVLTDDFHFVR
jgi:diadenosine tetraphosphate (Ap4A) HIT family hydrolase